jgi:hypothetical protein
MMPARELWHPTADQMVPAMSSKTQGRKFEHQQRHSHANTWHWQSPDAAQSMGVIVLTMHACECNGAALLQRRSNKRRTSVRSTWEVGMQTSTCGRTA